MGNRIESSLDTGLVYTVDEKNVNPVFVDSQLNEDSRVFNNLYHETEVHVPLEVLDVSDSIGSSLVVDDCLDMPIRLSGEEQYYIPDNWKPLWDSLLKIIDIEHFHNSSWRDYYTYLSVEYTGGLKAGEQQRHAGAHTDGFQGVRVKERTKSSRSYVAVTNGGTYYYPQSFVANLDASKFNVFQGFDLQIEKDDFGSPVRGVADEKKFYFFDAYTVHESGGAACDGSRLFVRLTWEMKKFDRSINTKNSMIDYTWEAVEYDVRQDLITPSLKDIEDARLVR